MALLAPLVVLALAAVLQQHQHAPPAPRTAAYGVVGVTKSV